MKDLSRYAQQWIALIDNDTIGGTGPTAKVARQQARQQYPQATLNVAWVSPHPPHIPLPAWPLEQVRALVSEGQVWLAGGPVRDLLLGRLPHDWDFAVAGDARACARHIANALGAAYYTLDDEHDAGRVLLHDPATQHTVVLDFARLRGDTLEADLRRRDFTINAMALSLEGQLIDPCGGQADLQKQCLRWTTRQSFQDDPARLLRAVRQATGLGFTIEVATQQAIHTEAGLVTTISRERVRDELLKILKMPRVIEGLQLAADLNLLSHVLPEVSDLQTLNQSQPHYCLKAWDHTLAALATINHIISLILQTDSILIAPPPTLPVPNWAWGTLERMLKPLHTPLREYLKETCNVDLTHADLLKWGTLLHDIGKTKTRTVDEDALTHFYGHAEQGAKMAQHRLRRLHFPNKARDFIGVLVREHMRLVSFGQTIPSRRAIYRFYRRTDNAGVAVVLLALADALAVWGPTLTEPRWGNLLAASERLLTHYFKRHAETIAPPPLLTGHDLLALDIPEGPKIGRLLEALREAQASGEINTREEAEVFIQKCLTLKKTADL